MKNKNKHQNDEAPAKDTGKVLTEDDLTEDKPEPETLAEQKPAQSEEQNGQIEDLKKQIEDLKKQNQDYLETAQRIQAEFDNYRRRNAEIASNSKTDGIKYAVEMLLPVIDSINSAKRQIKDETFLKSVELVYNQTLDCFSKLNVKKIDAVGKQFNPELHNAIMAEHVDGTEPDIVIDEFQEGFELNGKVIRHSVVKVSK